MTEDDARCWIAARFGEVATEALATFLEMVIAENEHQNLIAPSTVSQIWVRHALDSAQLLSFDQVGRWIDIGTGGGFPGLVAGILRRDPTTLVEPRRKRADFLSAAVAELALYHVDVVNTGIERLTGSAAVISARAVGSIDQLVNLGRHCSTPETRWLLPRGKIEDIDLKALRQRLPGMFHVEQSITDNASRILVLEGLSPQ